MKHLEAKEKEKKDKLSKKNMIRQTLDRQIE